MPSCRWSSIESVDVGGLMFDVGFAGPLEGSPIVLLHGFPESRSQWLGVLPALDQAGFRVIAPNLRGYSAGARPADVTEYGIDALVGDVVGLLDALGLQSAHLVGHDWGGTIAWFAAVRHPDRFRTLTAVSTAHPRAVVEAIGLDAEQRAAMQYIKQLRPQDSEERLRAENWQLIRTMCVDLPGDVLDEHLELLAEPDALTGAVNYYRAYDPAAAQALGACSVPTTFVWGSEDMAFRRSAAERTASHVSAPYRFLPMQGVGHWISDLEPDALAAAIVHRAGCKLH